MPRHGCLAANIEFVDDARTGMYNARQLSQMHDLQEKSVCGFCRLNEISLPRIRPLYTVDDSFFENLDDKAAYVLGWLASDGCVHSKEARITISLHPKDTSVLQSIKEMLRYSAPLRTYTGPQHVCVLSMSSHKLVADLAKYGIVPRKTNILEYPELPDHLHSHFMRGYSDGDGCITGNRQRSYEWKLSGRYEFLSKLDHVRRALGEDLGSLHPNKSIYCLSFGGRRAVEMTLNFLYESSTSATRLSRKYDKYLDALDEAESARRCTRYFNSESFLRDVAAGRSVSELAQKHDMPYHVVYNWVLKHQPSELHHFSKKRPRRLHAQKLRGIEKLKSSCRVRIKKDGKMFKGGTYDTESAAIVAYNDLATSLYGKDAILNTPLS